MQVPFVLLKEVQILQVVYIDTRCSSIAPLLSICMDCDMYAWGVKVGLYLAFTKSDVNW